MSNGQFPAVSDLAREVRYRYFDQPLFKQARKQVYAQVEEQLASMAAHPDAADRHERRPRLGRMSAASGGAPRLPLRDGGFRHAQADVGGDHLAVLSHPVPRELPLLDRERTLLRIGRIRS